MADDYLVRSGAKELLARAIASLLTVRPANAVAFLAQHFDTNAGTVERSVRLLRACPSHGAAFQDAIYQAFRWLSLDAAAAEPLSLVEGISSHSTTIPRSSYERVLSHLSADFPVHIKDRVVAAVQTTGRKSASEANVVSGEFQRGVRICVLLEELLDVVDELFLSMDKGGMGEVKLAVVVSALENASAQHLHATALDVLKTHLQTTASGSTPHDDDDKDIHRSIKLVDLQEIIFLAVFTP